MPSLSVIVPVYNKALFLEQCVASILGQTHADLEVLLINDGSTDHSGALCDDLAAHDSRVKVWHQPNSGVSAARNAGLAVAQGEYIGFVDADDCVEPSMYQILLRNARQHRAEVAAGRTAKHLPGKAVSETGTATTQTTVFTRQQAVAALLREEISGSVCDKLYLRTVLVGIRFKGNIYEDVHFNFQVLLQCHHFAFDTTVVYHYLVRNNSVSVSKFDRRYMDIFAVAGSIGSQVQARLPSLTSCAYRYQFMLDMFLVNLILLTSVRHYQAEYQLLRQDLRRITHCVHLPVTVARKHALAYQLLKLSPWCYTLSLRLYALLQRSEMRLRI